jgi:hypothetical protein
LTLQVGSSSLNGFRESEGAREADGRIRWRAAVVFEESPDIVWDLASEMQEDCAARKHHECLIVGERPHRSYVLLPTFVNEAPKSLSTDRKQRLAINTSVQLSEHRCHARGVVLQLHIDGVMRCLDAQCIQLEIELRRGNTDTRA